MRRWLLIGGGLLLLLVLAGLGAVGWAVQHAQRADYGWQPALAAPSFRADGPRVLIDEGHHNASTAGIGGRYYPLAKLLRADGFRVARGKGAFTAEALAAVDVLVIANASGTAKPQFMGINLPGGGDGDRAASAFTAAEIAVLRAWVEQGGGLLLIADHAPYGAAAAALGAAFGVTMHAGFTEIPDEVSDPLLFSRENGRLGEHPILTGGAGGKAVGRVATYTGQSLDGPLEATVLLRLPANAVEYIPAEPEFVEKQAGGAQGLAMPVGAGRVVVLGEAAMLTAQVYRGERFGLNAPGHDNQQFALHALHWLSGTLPAGPGAPESIGALPDVAAWLAVWSPDSSRLTLADFAFESARELAGGIFVTAEHGVTYRAFPPYEALRWVLSPDSAYAVAFLPAVDPESGVPMLEPDSAVELCEFASGRRRTILFCGTPCDFEMAVWVDARTVLIGAGDWDAMTPLLYRLDVGRDQLAVYGGPQQPAARQAELRRRIQRLWADRFPTLHWEGLD